MVFISVKSHSLIIGGKDLMLRFSFLFFSTLKNNYFLNVSFQLVTVLGFHSNYKFFYSLDTI
jgi:hypothetical protein